MIGCQIKQLRKENVKKNFGPILFVLNVRVAAFICSKWRDSVFEHPFLLLVLLCKLLMNNDLIKKIICG